jgi:hypothetical protein
MAEIYPHHWFDGTGSFIADSAGCGELISLFSEYEEIESLHQGGYLNDKTAAEALSDLDRRVREFATAWVHAHIRVDIDPGWLTWNSACVARLAERIQAGRHFEDLPVLADALEEAGCTNRAILDHLRGSGSHVLGCWAVHAILGKS